MADRQIFRRKRRRWGRWAALAAAVVLVLAWFNAPWIVERAALAALSRAGLDATIEVRRVGFFETVVDKVRIATPPVVTAEKVTIRYTPFAALRGDFYAAIFDGLTIEGGIAGTAIATIRLEAALRGYQGLKIRHIEFAEAKARLDVAGTPWNLSLRGMLALDGSGGFSGPISVVATSPGGAFGGEVRLAPDMEGRTAARLDVREAILRLPGITLEQVNGHVGIGHGPGPLPTIDVDLSMSGSRLDKTGLERARLRAVADGPTAIASLAGIDVEGRRFTVESAFDVAHGADGISFRQSRPGSLAFLDVPRLGRPPIGLDARIVPGDAPTLRIEPIDSGLRFVHALRLSTRMTTIVTPIGGVRVEGAEVAIDGQVDATGARGAATARRITAHLHDWEAIAEDATLVARWDEGPLRVEMTLPRLASTAAPAWFAPLQGELAATTTDGGVRLEGRLADRSGRAALTLTGMRRTGGDGSLRLAARPVKFGGDGANLAALSPALGGAVTAFSGDLGAEATLTWQGGRYESGGRLLLRDVAATLPIGRARRVNGVIALHPLWPPTTPGPQTLSIGGLDVGVPLSGGQIALSIEDGRPVLSNLRFGLFGGAITLAGPARIDLDAAAARIPLAAHGVDLAAAARGLGMDGLAIDGKVDGTIPLTVSNGRASVDGAAFRSTAPGYIAYRPGDASPPALGESGPGLQAMLETLRDFRFDDLRLGLETGPDGKPRLSVAARGSRGGTVSEFQLDLQGHGDRPADPAVDTHPVPEAIERLMKAFE